MKGPDPRPDAPRAPGAASTLLVVALSAFLLALWLAAWFMVHRAARDHLHAVAFQGVVALQGALRGVAVPDRARLREALEDFQAEGVLAVALAAPGGRILAASDEEAFDGEARALAAAALEAGEVRSMEARPRGGRPVMRVAVPRFRPGGRRGPAGPGPEGMPPAGWLGPGPDGMPAALSEGLPGAVPAPGAEGPAGPGAPAGGGATGAAAGAPPPDEAGGGPGPRPWDRRGGVAVLVDVDPAQVAGMVHWLWAQGLASLAVAAALAFYRARSRRDARAYAVLQAEARHRAVLARLGEMSAVLAHEVRNPLAAVKGHVQLAAEDAAAPEALRRRLGIVLEEVARLEALVRGLLEYATDRPPDRRPVPLQEVAARAVALARARPDLAGAAVEVEATGAAVPLDPDQAARLVANLLGNAMEAAGAGGRVRLRAVREAAEAVFTVEDSGPGVPAELAGRVFDPFVTGRARGVGLGLAIARRIAEAHGGTVEAGRSADLGGALFRARLPGG